MNDTEKALNYFKSRKAMMLADQVQTYENAAIEALEKQQNDFEHIQCAKLLEENGRLSAELTEWQNNAIKATATLGEIKLLEGQGLIVRLPCKVGDEVYILTQNKVSKVNVEWFDFEDKNLVVHGNGWNRVSYNFGKTVFLTQAEAEGAMK